MRRGVSGRMVSTCSMLSDVLATCPNPLGCPGLVHGTRDGNRTDRHRRYDGARHPLGESPRLGRTVVKTSLSPRAGSTPRPGYIEELLLARHHFIRPVIR